MSITWFMVLPTPVTTKSIKFFSSLFLSSSYLLQLHISTISLFHKSKREQSREQGCQSLYHFYFLSLQAITSHLLIFVLRKYPHNCWMDMREWILISHPLLPRIFIQFTWKIHIELKDQCPMKVNFSQFFLFYWR